MREISAIILTKNEERNIRRCLDGLKWCDEVIVIDDFSDDGTVKISRSRGATVYRRRLAGNFSSQRNFGLKKARGRWVLFIDADEAVSPSLAKEIVRRVRGNDNYSGFYLPRRPVFINRKLSFSDKPIWDWSIGPIYLLRLAKKDAGVWQGKVHEQWQIKGNLGRLKNPLLHYSFPNITTALKKINYYSSLRVKELLEEEGRTSATQIILYPLGKFLKNFFWHRGFQDGTRGLVFCLLMSLHSFLVRGKLWQAQGR